MTSYKVAIGAVALGFTLASVPVWADQRPGGGEGGGGPRGGGGGGGASSSSGNDGARGSGGGGSSGSSSSSSSSDSGGSGGGATFAPAPSSRPAVTERAPQHPRAAERQSGGERSRGGAPATGRAVPRGTDTSGGDATTSSSSGGRDHDRATSPRDRAVPVYSRPREGRPTTGRATERFTPPPGRPGRDGYGYYYSPYPYGYYHDPYGYYGSYWYPGYSLGLGYFYYDPFWYGSYGGYAYPGGYGRGQYSYGEAGALRLKIKPRDAQVFVDGYFVGTVDSFDGVFQRLSVEAGAHKIEIRAPGYETLQFDVLITPGETVTFKGDLERVQ